MDMTSLLSQVMESRIAGLMYQNMQKTQRVDRSVPDSTRRAFDSKMESDAGVFRQSSQNMKDAMSMVSIAQSGVTTIKHHLTEMFKIATEMTEFDNMSDEQYRASSKMLKEQSDLIVSLAKNIEFNGMNLLDGSAGMNGDGTVVLQAGGSPMEQVFTNLLDGGTSVMNNSGSMNLELLEPDTNITNQTEARELVEKLNTYIQRINTIEADYSFDIKALENLSVLFENKADIFENTIQYKESDDGTEQVTSADYLAQLMAGNSNGSIFSGQS